MDTNEFITNIVNGMTPYLTMEQITHLRNILYIQLRNKNIIDSSTELAVSELSENERKIRLFVASKRMQNTADSTLKQYVNEIRKVLFALNKNVEDVTAMDLRYYYGVLRENGRLSARTIQGRLHYLSSFYDFLLAEGLVTSNPVKKIGTIKVEKTIKQPYSDEELEKLRTSCKTARDRAIVEFLYSTGVRLSEMIALNVGDVDFNNQELIVNGKGNKERKTYLTNLAVFYLKRYLQTRPQGDGFLNEPLFVTNRKPYKRITKAGVQYMLRDLGKISGVENVHPHRFRRTIATHLLNHGMPIEEVKAFLGHEKLETTLIYCTILEESVHASHRKCS